MDSEEESVPSQSIAGEIEALAEPVEDEPVEDGSVVDEDAGEDDKAIDEEVAEGASAVVAVREEQAKSFNEFGLDDRLLKVP